MSDPLQNLPSEIQDHRILDTAQAAAFCGYSVSQWRSLYRTGAAPRPIELSARHYGWKFRTLVEWVNAKASPKGQRDPQSVENAA